MSTNIFNNQIYSLDNGGNTPAIFFRDNAAGDLGWIIGAHDRGGNNTSGANALLMFTGAPDDMLTDSWDDWVTTTGSFTTNSNLPSSVTYVCTFTQQSSGGRWGINTQEPAYKVHVVGTFYASGSSLEYKENIENYTISTNLINKLRPVNYDYKKEYKDFGKKMSSDNQLGYIAEEVSNILPELSILLDEKVKNVDYEKLSVVALSYYQQLESRVSILEGES